MSTRQEKCPFNVGDLVVYKPSQRGHNLIDGERLVIGKEYRISAIEQDNSTVISLH